MTPNRIGTCCCDGLIVARGQFVVLAVIVEPLPVEETAKNLDRLGETARA